MEMAGLMSDKSKRIAKNTLLLYFRMLLLMFIGLFTSRVVLSALGVSDFGIYNAVGDVVLGFTFITTSLSSSITRYVANSLGCGDQVRLKRVFSTSRLIMYSISVLMVILVLTMGRFFLHTRMQIPDGRMDAAELVLICALSTLVLNLLSVPYNATIVAHERMGAFALISVLEGALKLTVALLLSNAAADRLKFYALLMLGVALIVRGSYGLYCRIHFAESRGGLVLDRKLIGEMTGFAGWSFFGSSAYVFNTKGVNLLANVFFGVTVNAARGVAGNVENILKQFVSNFLTALNPQISKSWASGDREYCFELVSKGAKYTFWMLFMMFIPIVVWTEPLLRLWLGEVPKWSVTFTRLTLIGLIIDMTGNTLVTLVQAIGKVKRYYLVTGLVSYACFPIVWLLFSAGAGPQWAYVGFIVTYALVFLLKLIVVSRQAGFPKRRFLCGFFTVTPGESALLLRKLGRFLPDRLYLRWKYRLSFGEKLHLDKPASFSEKIQWLKLNDRNPLYHTLVDKAEVKRHVSGIIGPEYVVPTLGVWNRAEDIDWESLPERFVLKCTHDSGSAIVVNDKLSIDRKAVCMDLAAALKTDFYKRDREWAYRGVKPRVIAEKYLGTGVPDYKFFCFNGKPELMFVATDRASREEETKFDFFDMSFNHIDVRNGHPNSADTPAEPQSFELMKELAAKLSEGMLHVRIDFYEAGGQVYFGEYTFYHWSGFVPFEPDSFDYKLGHKLKLPLR